MRGRFLTAALSVACVALAAPGAAGAAQAGATEFTGECVIDAQVTLIPGNGSLVNSGYDVHGAGTCTGTLDGGEPTVHPVTLDVEAGAVVVGPEPDRAMPVTGGGMGDVTFTEFKGAVISFRFTQLGPTFLVSGNAGGELICEAHPHSSGSGITITGRAPRFIAG